MHTPKGARRVGGCSSDRRSGGDKTVWGWMVVYGLVSVGVLTYILKKREREPVRQVGSQFPCVVYPNNNTPNETVDACVKVIMVWRKGEGAYEGVIDWLRVHKCSR